MSERSADGNPKAFSRVRGWVLTLSLALNLLVVGLGIGSWLRHAGPDAPKAPPERRLNFGQWAAGLERADHQALRRGFEARGVDFRQDREAEMADRLLMLDALRAQPFDPAQFGAIADRITGRGLQRMELGGELLRDHVIAMSPERRLSFADRLEVEVKKAGQRPRVPRPAN